MANILEFLRGLLTNAGEQRQFATNPHAYLTAHGFGDLSGEDVAEAIAVVSRTLPDDLPSRLGAFSADDDSLPPVRPQVGESELDAAVRQLQFATSLTPAGESLAVSGTAAAGGAGAGEGDGEGEGDDGGAEDETHETTGDTAELTTPEDERVADVKEAAEGAEEAAVEETAAAGSAETEGAARPPAWPEDLASVAAGPHSSRTGTIDPYAAFGEEISSIIRHAGEQMQIVLERAEEQADAIIRQAEREADAIRVQAEGEANSMRGTAAEEAGAIRAAAQVDAQNMRDTATQESDAILQAAKSAREEARIFKQSARDEANAILQNARTTQEEAQRQASELIKNSEREASAMLAEARSRRDEIRDAERELRKRLQGVETVFRTLQEGSVVPDHPDDE